MTICPFVCCFATLHPFCALKWLIFALSKLGMTWNLKRIPDEKILASKMEMREKQLAALSVKKAQTTGFAEGVAAMRESGEKTLVRIQERFDELAKTMKEMRKAKKSRTARYYQDNSPEVGSHTHWHCSTID